MVAIIALLAACGRGTVDVDRSAGAVASGEEAARTATEPERAGGEPAAEATTSTVPLTAAPAPATTVPLPRIVASTAFSPLATAGPVTVVHPADEVERVGFHQSGHDGARMMDATPTAARSVVLETRERGTGARTAADIVVRPDTEIRAPVTGTVKRAGGYILYCDHQDDFVVIEPDERPGWEVKLLHIDGVQVRAGDRVDAGVTLIAPRATVLPFESQVDELTAAPSWPHVHLEIVDPSIPDRPSSGGGCS